MYHIGDRVAHPMHGAGTICAIQEQRCGGEECGGAAEGGLAAGDEECGGVCGDPSLGLLLRAHDHLSHFSIS